MTRVATELACLCAAAMTVLPGTNLRLSQATSMQLNGHSGPVNAVAFDPASKTLASAGDDGTVRIWEAMPVRP